VVCYECGNENASMNLICAYCGVPFASDHLAARQRAPAGCEPVTGAMLVLALVVPVVGLVAGFAAMRRPGRVHCAASQRWLIAALCSSLAYIALLIRYLAG
jgi:hypothetical protein